MDTAYELLIEKLSRQASAKNIPLNGSFELTARCNFNCRMCYIHDRKCDHSIAARELTADQWIKLAEDARDAGMLNLVLTGGEIFLRSDFRQIYESAARMGFKITLYTNASLIDSEKAKWLGKLPPTSVEITLYGASADTYEKICGNAKAYNQVISAIDMLLAEGINIELKTTVTKDMIDDYEAMAEFSFKRGTPLNIVNYLYPAKSTCTANNCRLSPEELVDFEEKFRATNHRLREVYSKGALSEQTAECAKKLVRDLNDMKPDAGKSKSAFSCNVGSSDFWIAWDGRMLPCGIMEEPALLPLEIGFASAWTELGKQCRDIPVCRECEECSIQDYCIACPAKLKTETGSYDKPAEYLCRLTRLVKERFPDNKV